MDGLTRLIGFGAMTASAPDVVGNSAGSSQKASTTARAAIPAFGDEDVILTPANADYIADAADAWEHYGSVANARAAAPQDL